MPRVKPYQVEVALILALLQEGLHGINVHSHIIVHLEVVVSVDLLGQHSEHLQGFLGQVIVGIYDIQPQDVPKLSHLLLQAEILGITLLFTADKIQSWINAAYEYV